ncbi:MAG: response regulator, partial [Methyloceanibacter sp.]
LYRVQRPDVIIVDLAMRTGALGGLSFIRRLRLHDQRTPVLVFTMHAAPVIVSRALEVGATGYLRCAKEGPISVTISPPRWPSWKRGEPPIR